MKKIIIATIAGLAMQVSMSEAQTSPKREVNVPKQYVDPPPPPPAPPEPPAPPAPPQPQAEQSPIAPIPPVPPVPPVAPEAPVPPPVEGETPALMPRIIVRELSSSPVNAKGYQLFVKTENEKSVVLVKRSGRIIKKIPLHTWLASNDKYEKMYGKLPPPPPPAPPAPEKESS